MSQVTSQEMLEYTEKQPIISVALMRQRFISHLHGPQQSRLLRIRWLGHLDKRPLLGSMRGREGLS